MGEALTSRRRVMVVGVHSSHHTDISFKHATVLSFLDLNCSRVNCILEKMRGNHSRGRDSFQVMTMKQDEERMLSSNHPVYRVDLSQSRCSVSHCLGSLPLCSSTTYTERPREGVRLFAIICSLNRSGFRWRKCHTFVKLLKCKTIMRDNLFVCQKVQGY